MEWPGCSPCQPIQPHTACSRPGRSHCMYQARRQRTQWHPHPSLRQHHIQRMEWPGCSPCQPFQPHTACRSQYQESRSCQEHTQKRLLHSSPHGSPRYRCTGTRPRHRSTIHHWHKAGCRTRSHCSSGDSSCSTLRPLRKPCPGSRSRQPPPTGSRSRCSLPVRTMRRPPPAGFQRILHRSSQPGTHTGTIPRPRSRQSTTRCRFHCASMAAQHTRSCR